MPALFAHLIERWDGKGGPGGVRGEEIPLPVRIALVARDAAFQRMLGGAEFAAGVIGKRPGGRSTRPWPCRWSTTPPRSWPSTPAVSAWEETLAREPAPRLALEGEAIDRALGALGAFADCLADVVGHSGGVAELARRPPSAAAPTPGDLVQVRRAAFVHDLGRVASRCGSGSATAPSRQTTGRRCGCTPTTPSGCSAARRPSASSRRWRDASTSNRDGRGYHRGTGVAEPRAAGPAARRRRRLPRRTEPGPSRPAPSAKPAADKLRQAARAGRLDPDAVAAVLEAAGQRGPRIEPAGRAHGTGGRGVALLAHGLATKQIARRLGVTLKTADRHVQQAYAKIGVSTRAAAALFAMQHGLTASGRTPIGPARDRS